MSSFFPDLIIQCNLLHRFYCIRIRAPAKSHRRLTWYHCIVNARLGIVSYQILSLKNDCTQAGTPGYPSHTVKFSFFVKVPEIVLPERVPSGASTYHHVLAGHFADDRAHLPSSSFLSPSLLPCFLVLNTWFIRLFIITPPCGNFLRHRFVIRGSLLALAALSRIANRHLTSTGLYGHLLIRRRFLVGELTVYFCCFQPYGEWMFSLSRVFFFSNYSFTGARLHHTIQVLAHPQMYFELTNFRFRLGSFLCYVVFNINHVSVFSPCPSHT